MLTILFSSLIAFFASSTMASEAKAINIRYTGTNPMNLSPIINAGLYWAKDVPAGTSEILVVPGDNASPAVFSISVGGAGAVETGLTCIAQILPTSSGTEATKTYEFRATTTLHFATPHISDWAYVSCNPSITPKPHV